MNFSNPPATILMKLKRAMDRAQQAKLPRVKEDLQKAIQALTEGSIDISQMYVEIAAKRLKIQSEDHSSQM